jgi:hypothetical protein
MAGPWEKYSTQARENLTSGPWSKYGQPQPVGDAVKAEAKAEVQRETEAGIRPMPRLAEGIPLIGGLLDEFVAAPANALLYGLTGGRTGAPYEKALELERERSRVADEQNPAMAATGKLAAGLATGGNLLAGVAPAATLAGRVGQGVAIGAPLAAVEGFTRGEGGLGNRMEEAGKSAAIGGAVGAAFPVVGAGLSRAYGAAADAVAPGITRMRSGPEAAADEILARRIAREGSSPAQKRLDLQTGQQMARVDSNSQAQLPETLADTSDAMQRLTGSVYRAGGEAGNFAKWELQGRQRGPDNPFAPGAAAQPPGQRQRLLDTTERTLLIKTSDTARKTDQRIMADQARQGRDLYNQAYNSSEAFDLDPAIQAMALKVQQYPGPFAAQLQRAVNLFRKSGTKGNAPYWVDDIRRFDSAKKALDDQIDVAQRAGKNNLVRELTDFKQSLLTAVHGFDNAGNATRNRVYDQARKTWGSAAENREAIELGRSALRDGSEISAENYRALTQGQQTLFRLGFMESLRNAMGRTRPGNDATLLFQEPRVQDLMSAIIPASKGKNAVFNNRPERFGEILQREERMVQTRNAVLGNSATAQRQQDDMEFAGDTLRNMYDRFRQAPGLVNMGIEAVGVGIQKMFGYRQDVALALAQRLLTTDRATQNQILARLRARGGPDVFARFADTVDRSAAQIAASSQPALADLTNGDR